MSARLRILLIGASGVLGRAVAAELSPRHDIVSAGSKTGDIRIDIADPASIEAGLKAAGPLDAVACAAGAVNFHPLSAIKPAPLAQSSYGLGLANKLMGQVNLALAARDHLNDGGSITLIAGVLSGTADRRRVVGQHGQRGGRGVRDGGGDRNAARHPHQCREPDGRSRNRWTDYGPFFRGHDPVPVARAARAFSRSIEGWRPARPIAWSSARDAEARSSSTSRWPR